MATAAAMATAPSRMLPLRLAAANTTFFLCDQQTRFRPLIRGAERTIACGKALLRTARELEIPVVVTEQYPEKLGNTVPELIAELDPARSRTVAKSTFGMGEQPEEGRGSVVLWGWEAHVCVQQTVLELVEAGRCVWVPLDAIGSQRALDFRGAVEQFRGLGVRLSSTESIIFELLRTKEHTSFKALSGVAKDLAGELRELPKEEAEADL